MQSLSGHFLISATDLQDPFYRTVVLMVSHDDHGALGLILNRPLTTTLAEVWAKLSSVVCQRTDPLCFGGPCEGPLMVLHQEAKLAESQPVSGVFFSTQRESIEALVRRAETVARFYVGYSGWAAGQLEEELQRGAWLTTPATSEQVFAQPQDELWQSVRSDIAKKTVISKLPIKHVPPDPRMN